MSFSGVPQSFLTEFLMFMTEKAHYLKIWRTALQIPRGKVASYGQVADLAGLPRRARLVGKAMGFAPKEMNIPWYRILRVNGQIAFPKGSELALKQTELLQGEGVAVLNSRVKLKEFQWVPDLGELLALEY